MLCQHCGMENDATKNFCVYCGKKLENKAEAVKCVHCGTALTEDMRFCINCGTKTGFGTDPPPAPVVTPAAHISAVPVQTVTPAQTPAQAVPPVKRKTGLIVFVCLFLAVVAGVGIGGGVYVNINGWDALPFFRDKNIETAIDVPASEALPQTVETPASEAMLPLVSFAIFGDWMYEDANTRCVLRLKLDNTFLFAAEFWTGSGEDRALMQAVSEIGTSERSEDGGSLLLYGEDNGILSASVPDAEHIAILNLRDTVPLDAARSVTLTAAQLADEKLTGIWQLWDSELTGMIEFSAAGTVIFGEPDVYNTDAYTATGSADYTYDTATYLLTLINTSDASDNLTFLFEIVGDYAFMYHDDVGLLKKHKGGAFYITREYSRPSYETSPAVPDYILPDSAIRLLTYDDLSGLSVDELRIARNEIYARHGRMFSDADLQAYFDGKRWYFGSIAPNDFLESTLSEIEKDNVTLIQEAENLQP